MPSDQLFVAPRWETTTPSRCKVVPLVAGRPNKSGSWWTTMMTATPARNPVMIGRRQQLRDPSEAQEADEGDDDTDHDGEDPDQVDVLR